MNPIDDAGAIPDTATTTIPVPEWGPDAAVICKTLSAPDLDKLELEHADKEGNLILEGYRPAYVVACLVRSDGTKLFDTPAKVERLKRWGRLVSRLFLECQRFNGGDNPVKN